jgi:N-acetylneuraminic acid mutarotase
MLLREVMSRHKRSRCSTFFRALEALETRRLFHDGVALHFAFALPTTLIDEPYNKDSGAVLSAQDDGVVYGWSSDNSANVHERHDVPAPDLLHRGYAILPPADQNVWQVQVPEDDYTVHIVAGDAASSSGRYRIDVNGILTVDGTATAANPWVEGTQTITATGGLITISSAPGATTNKIDYIDLTPFDDPDTISVAAAPKAFVFTRTGSVSAEATYNYLIGGSAKSGRDYQQLDGVLDFPVGASSVTVPVQTLPDLSGTKTVNVTLVPGETFLNGQLTATVSIAQKTKQATAQSSAFSTTRINFQPDGTPVPDYYKVDTGMTYGKRANGMTYGWSADNRVNTRDDNSSLSPDQRYDTFDHMQKNGSNMSWSMAVPNGTYTVRVVAGDPNFIDSSFQIAVEGVLTVSGTPTTANHWVEGTKTVQVTDGKLTISNAAGAKNNKINFVEIAPGTHNLPVVSVAASGQPAEGTASGKFTVTRTGDLSQPLTVSYSLGGSAINGTDYDLLSGAVSIPAGKASADIVIHPIDDTIAEGTENVTFALITASSYSNGQVETASRTILDNDISTTPNGKLKFTTGANDPISRAEAMGAVVNGKVYAFGGYVDRTYHPVATVNVYDVASGKWSTLADMPFGGITHSGITVDGSNIYFAGGYPASATKGQTFSTRNVWKFDTTNNTWTAMPPLPAGRGAGTMVNLNHVLYFFGGADPNRNDASEMWKLDLNNMSAGWNTVASLPAPRNHVGGVALDGFIYALGGQTGQDNLSVFKGDVWRYDPSTNKWSTMASLPGQPRSHIAAASFAYNGEIITMGGEGPGRVALNYVQEYNPATNTWVSLTPLPGGRSSGIGVNLGNGDIMYTSGYDGFFSNQTWIGTFSG